MSAAVGTRSRLWRVYLRDEVVPVFSITAAEGKRLFRAFLKDISAKEEASLIAGLRKIKVNAVRRLDRPDGPADS